MTNEKTVEGRLDACKKAAEILGEALSDISLSDCVHCSAKAHDALLKSTAVLDDFLDKPGMTRAQVYVGLKTL